MVYFCQECCRYVPWVNLPEWRCRICLSFFVDETPDDQVAPEVIQLVRQERDQALLGQFRQLNEQNRQTTTTTPQVGPNWTAQQSRQTRIPQPSWGVQPGTYRRRSIQIPLPPNITTQQPPRRQMFVTPQGFIVDNPGPSSGIVTEREALRRRAALLIRPRQERDGEDCYICLDPHSDTVAATQVCDHSFHQACFERWLEQKNACPLCTKTVAP